MWKVPQMFSFLYTAPVGRVKERTAGHTKKTNDFIGGVLYV